LGLFFIGVDRLEELIDELLEIIAWHCRNLTRKDEKDNVRRKLHTIEAMANGFVKPSANPVSPHCTLEDLFTDNDCHPAVFAVRILDIFYGYKTSTFGRTVFIYVAQTTMSVKAMVKCEHATT
jgi:hypothetical protein